MSLVLAVDVGTTKMKTAVVEDGRRILASAEQAYPITIRAGGQRDIDTEHWWNAFLECCARLKPYTGGVQAAVFSVSTPGATAFGPDGEALTPAVLFLDGRSGRQAQRIRDLIGEDELLEQTGNLPVSGGCTAATLLWWKDQQPEIFSRAAMFGHTNTLFGQRLTGNWGMDPSTASLTALYRTTRIEGGWIEPIASRLGIPLHKLPPLVNSWEPVGGLLPRWADITGMPAGTPILMGGNDAMCAALHGGVIREGATLDICGTCEILSVGLARALPGRNYNLRRHVIPNLWATLYVLNTGGKALEWFHENFCREMSADAFFHEYIPRVIHDYFDNEASRELPEYEVFLAGDRYSTKDRRAAFSRITLETRREDLLMALIRGNNEYMARHLREMGEKIALSDTIHLTGGGLTEPFLRCKQRWMGEYHYVLRENSSLLGAAQLGHFFVTGEAVWEKVNPSP
ncbi:MAG TPA: FGGY family carbohydrate kinase [bacterium]|nr:FGGY family carbohydrate kinase [bacterium]HPP00992.1 FGGY family carbohydrate kinase [bacterium]